MLLLRRWTGRVNERIAGPVTPRDTGKALTGPMLGAFWRYRVGDYRIICDIQDGACRVLVIEIDNRKKAPQTLRLRGLFS